MSWPVIFGVLALAGLAGLAFALPRLRRSPDERVEYFRYVSWDELPAATVDGWIFDGPAPGHHGQYSAVVRWGGKGEPK